MRPLGMAMIVAGIFCIYMAVWHPLVGQQNNAQAPNPGAPV